MVGFFIIIGIIVGYFLLLGFFDKHKKYNNVKQILGWIIITILFVIAVYIMKSS